ncbi:MAG: lysophospholipid acyltransferase family protein [Anaerolineales bacterium]
MLIKFILFFFKIIIPVITRIEVHGDVKALNRDRQINVVNHIGILEVLLAYYFINREDIIMILAEKHQSRKFINWLAGQLNATFIDRYNADLSTTRKVLRRLQDGGVMTVAPEGTRSPDGSLQKGRMGVSYLASKTGALVLPAAVIGTEDAVVKSKLLHLQPVPVTIWIGEPFTIPPISGGNRREKLQEYTDEIMCHIAALLPEERRGYYTNHPRLKELLASQTNP